MIKEVHRIELQSFLEVAPLYFEYMSNALFYQLPTILAKILGVYTIRYRNSATGKDSSHNLVVMENLFYDRTISRVNFHSVSVLSSSPFSLCVLLSSLLL